MNQRLHPLATLAAFALTSSAYATLITYDGFTGGTGVLHGTSSVDSTNWRNPWDNQGGTLAVGYSYSNASPLTFGLLLSSPDYATGGNAFQTTGRDVLANFGSAWDLAGAVSSPFNTQRVDSGVVWASFMLRKDVNNQSPNAVTFHPSNIPWFTGGTPRLSVGYIGGEFGPGLSDVGGGKFIAIEFVGSATVSAVTPVPVVIGQTNLIVLKFDFDADQVSLYVDPSTLGGPPPASPTAVLAMEDGFGIRSIGWYAGRDPGSGSLDEIRMGTTYASVTPLIPEPAMAGVLAPAALLLVRRRK